MFEVIVPAHHLLQPFIQYIYKFSVNDPGFNRKLVIFPNTGAAITFYKDLDFVEKDYQHFLSVEKKGETGVVLHLNRAEPITIQESGRQQRIGIVFKPLGVNQFLQYFPGELRETNNPSLIPVTYFDPSFALFSKKLDMDQPLSHISRSIEELLLKNYTGFTNAVLERCIHEITHPGESKKIGELAQQANAATKTINRLFHKYIGLSPVEFRKITQFRNALKTKLENKAASISSIALEHNYYDLPYMIKVFRKFTGINANEFFSHVTASGNGQYVYIG